MRNGNDGINGKKSMGRVKNEKNIWKKQKHPKKVKMQKNGRSKLTYLRGHFAFISECRYVEFCEKMIIQVPVGI